MPRVRQIYYSESLTGVDSDILSGTELEASPGGGVYVVRAASTVVTATLAVKGSGGPAVSDPRAIQLRANAEVLASDAPWMIPVIAGEKVTIALAGTTGTVRVECQYYGT